MAKAKKNSKITLSEFRAWLSGVEEMQDDNWAPSQSQWETIRRKMDLIIEDEAPAAPAQVPVVHQQPVQYAQPQQPSAMPSAPVVSKPSNVGSGLTPDIDTSDGNYTSSFE